MHHLSPIAPVLDHYLKKGTQIRKIHELKKNQIQKVQIHQEVMIEETMEEEAEVEPTL